ncbi:uncharacterized protein TNCV_2385391 [Trichonephila clavipes]|nr:uncharacterized protein TNCV_2385391 [Trichonephila clavipes]
MLERTATIRENPEVSEVLFIKNCLKAMLYCDKFTFKEGGKVGVTVAKRRPLSTFLNVNTATYSITQSAAVCIDLNGVNRDSINDLQCKKPKMIWNQIPLRQERPGQGHECTEDRYLALTACRNRKATARQLSSEFAAATGAVASRQTIYNARKPRECYAPSGPWVAWWLEHRTPGRKAWVRCPMPPNTLRIHTEYVFVKSVGPKVLWAESRMQGTGEYFHPLQSHGKIVEVEIGGVAFYRPFGEFRRAKSYCHLYGAQGLGQRQAYF